MTQDRDRAKKYFDDLAAEYDRAFRLEAKDPLNAFVNRLFRGHTFIRRMQILDGLLREMGLAGKTVLDLGCGSGQVSLLAASMGARVHAMDIAPRMIAIARDAATRSGLSERVRFEEGDVSAAPFPEADVTLLVGVIEYYSDYTGLIHRAAAATRQALVIAHTSRVLYRMALRRLLFWLQGSSLYFHPMINVVRAAEAAGLRLRREVQEHAFSVLVFERAWSSVHRREEREGSVR